MKIAITRLTEKGCQDAEMCASFGHESCIISPLAAVLDIKEIAAFLSAYNSGLFDAVFFTSAYPAEKAAPKMQRGICRIIAVGPKTAEILARYGHEAEVLPQFTSKAFVPYLQDWIAGKRIGIPRAAVENKALIDKITAAGAVPFEFRCYALQAGGDVWDVSNADAVLFTSARSFTDAVLSGHEGKLLIAVGEMTAEAMRNKGVNPDVVGDGSLAGTLAALNQHLKIK